MTRLAGFLRRRSRHHYRKKQLKHRDIKDIPTQRPLEEAGKKQPSVIQREMCEKTLPSLSAQEDNETKLLIPDLEFPDFRTVRKQISVVEATIYSLLHFVLAVLTN